MSSYKSLNEENIKVKIVVPALIEIGFKESDLVYEKAIRASSPNGEKTLFADIVANNEFGLPVLVIEVKRWNRDVKSEDVLNQVRTYAEKLGNSVEYALATNGHDITFIDMQEGNITTATAEKEMSFVEIFKLKMKRKIQSIPCIIDAETALHISKNKTIAAISLLKATSERIVDQKYIPELYVHRTSLERRILDFIFSENNIFAVVGDAGFGKTNLFCSIAESLFQDNLVLFYNGFQLYEGVSEKLKKDLKDIVFSEDLEDGLQRLSCIPSLSNKSLVIIIDAINECGSGRDKLQSDLDELVGLSVTYPIKLIVSCRSQDWDNWLRPNGKSLGQFGLAVKGFSDSKSSMIINICAFSEPEFVIAWVKYKKHFDLIGEPSLRLKRLCLEPFMLRVVSEVYRGRKELPEYIEPISLFRRYFEEKYTTIKSQQGARRFLYWLGLNILDSGNSQIGYLSVPLDQLEVCDDLLDERILLASYEDGSERYIVFTYELFLEFIISEAILHKLHAFGPLSEEIISTEISRLKGFGLINVPGVIENIILATIAVPGCYLQSLKLLIGWGGNWEAIAVSAIKKNQNPPVEILELMLQLACSSNYVIRLFLSQSLGNFLRLHGDRFIELSINSEHWEVRETAANVIAVNGESARERGNHLIQLMDDFHWRVRRAAGYAICQMLIKGTDFEDSFWSELIANLSRKTWREKYSIAIGLMGRTGHVLHDQEILLSLASDENRQVRWAIANYAHRYQFSDVESLLRSIFSDSDEWVRRRAVLSTIDGMLSGALRFDKQFLSEMSIDKDEGVRVVFARNVGRLSRYPEVRQVLRSLLKDTINVAFAAYWTLLAAGEACQFIAESKFNQNILSLREQVARNEIDERASRFRSMNEYIARRSEYVDRNDPYMQVIDTMCAIIANSVEDLVDTDIEPFLSTLEKDPDEGVRWAFVMYLAHYDHLFSHENKLEILERLSIDSHWWVRREVALAVGVLGVDHGLREKIKKLLVTMNKSEIESFDDCGDEVLYSINLSMKTYNL